jgi:hypothetical protein
VTVRALSFGGGRQTVALLVLAATGEVPIDVALFANVGDDSEDPATLDYFHNHAKPYADRHGIPLHELRRTWRTGEQTTLLDYVMGPTASIPIPVKVGDGAPGTRQCSERWKIAVVARWLKDHGASRDDPAELAIGFSWDEVSRLKDIADPYARRVYPLIERRLNLADCLDIIHKAGLPEPPRSSCWFCPNRGHRGFAEMRRDRPVLFYKAVEVEDRCNEKRAAMGKDPVWFTETRRPLSELTVAQDSLFDVGPVETCDTEACFV